MFILGFKLISYLLKVSSWWSLTF